MSLLDRLGLNRPELRAWAILDTYDALSPRYDFPQTLETVREWCDAAGLVEVTVREAGNGIEVTAQRGRPSQ